MFALIKRQVKKLLQATKTKENKMSELYKYFSRKEILHDRDVEYPLTPELEANLERLLTALNKFREAYGKPMYVSSGYRPGKYNTAAGGAKRSAHLFCLACDFADPHGEVDAFALANLDKLKEWGLCLENPKNTKNWCHLDLYERLDSSGNRIAMFNP